MINTIVFDIGNVLAPFTWRETYADLFDEETAAKVGEATVLYSEMWAELDKGSLPDEAIIEEFKKKNPEVADKIENAVWEIYRRMNPYSYASDWLRTLREQGYKIYILSNYGRTGFNLSKPRFDFLKYAHGGVISYQVEINKPDPRIYMILCQKYGISPNEAIFIDDNADNIEAAANLGFNTILHKDEETSIKKFAELGVEIK
ncbi:MAG: HAD family phosphatase [Clostridia bacterium]|nr:HAD family phosphatase [Clostridia bacterium]